MIIKLVCVATPRRCPLRTSRCNHTRAVQVPGFAYVSTLHQPTLQPSAAARPTCGSGSRICKTSYRCPLYITFPLLLEPALSLLGADHLIAFGVDQPARISQGAQAAFSVFCVRDTHSYPQARYFTHGLSVCLHQQSLQLLLIFYLLLATEEIRTPSIITFANDATLSVVTVLLSEPTQPLFTTPMARRILQFACYKEPSVLLDSSRALSLKRILGQYIHWYYCCLLVLPLSSFTSITQSFSPKYFPLGRSRALSSTTMTGIYSLIQWASGAKGQYRADLVRFSVSYTSIYVTLAINF